MARMQGTYRPHQTQPEGSNSWAGTSGTIYVGQSPNSNQVVGTATVSPANGLLPTADTPNNFGTAAPDAVRSTNNNFCQPVSSGACPTISSGTQVLAPVAFQPNSGKVSCI
eukprot:15219140-Ditylum_brightwellii.AAC.1